MSTDLKYFDLITAKTMTTRTNNHCLTAGIPGTNLGKPVPECQTILDFVAATDE